MGTNLNDTRTVKTIIKTSWLKTDTIKRYKKQSKEKVTKDENKDKEKMKETK